MYIQFVDDYIEKKVEEDENYIICSYFELRVKYDKSEAEVYEILRLLKNRLTNMRYNLYYKGDDYSYYGKPAKVKGNQFFVAIKERGL